MAMRWISLFQGLKRGDIDFGNGGLVISARFHNLSNYAIFETVAFDNIKNIAYGGGDDVTFQSDGYRVFMIYEPRSYSKSFQEPYLRDPDQAIPLRWNELDKIELPNRNQVFVSKQPYISYGSFTVEAPADGDFAFYIFDTGGDTMERNATEFVDRVLKEDFEVPTKSRGAIVQLFAANLAIFRRDTANHG
jgi:hypothetical protein